LNKLQSPDVCEQEKYFLQTFDFSMVTLVQGLLFANLLFVATIGCACPWQTCTDLSDLHV